MAKQRRQAQTINKIFEATKEESVGQNVVDTALFKTDNCELDSNMFSSDEEEPEESLKLNKSLPHAKAKVIIKKPSFPTRPTGKPAPDEKVKLKLPGGGKHIKQIGKRKKGKGQN